MDRFEGFADATGKFFKSLAKHNERPWFQTHKEEFETGWKGPMKLLLAEVKDTIDSAYEHCDLGEPKLFRIFRDVRFSKDKSPYKTHLGGLIPVARTGRKVTDLPIALYFHVGDRETVAAAGHYIMEPDSLARFRAALDDPRGKELEGILKRLGRKGYTASSNETAKRVPKGFAPDHPRAEMLRWKGLIVDFPPLPAGMLATPKLVKWLAAGCKATVPLVEWLVFATS